MLYDTLFFAVVQCLGPFAYKFYQLHQVMSIKQNISKSESQNNVTDVTVAASADEAFLSQIQKTDTVLDTVTLDTSTMKNPTFNMALYQESVTPSSSVCNLQQQDEALSCNTFHSRITQR